MQQGQSQGPPVSRVAAQISAFRCASNVFPHVRGEGSLQSWEIHELKNVPSCSHVPSPLPFNLFNFRPTPKVSDFLEMSGVPDAHGALLSQGLLHAWKPGNFESSQGVVPALC